MYETYKLYKADNPLKRYKIYVDDYKNKTIKKVEFGSSNYDNYTIHKDIARLKKYILRHQKNEDWTDWTSAGFWSRWLLWNEYSTDIHKNLLWTLKYKVKF